jgi:hypothetical protein
MEEPNIMMTPERIAELRGFYHASGSVVRECLDEIERLDNITVIQQKQIERLMDARDAEMIKNGEWEKLVRSILENCSTTDVHEKRYLELCRPSPCPTNPPTPAGS